MRHKPFPTTPFLLIAGILLGFLIGRITWWTEAPVIREDIQPVAESVQKSAENLPQPAEAAITPKALDEITGISADDDDIMGNPSAPLLIVEFTDYQCSYCKKYFETIFKRIKEDYLDTGKARYVVRDFPLEEYPQSTLAANTAECAGEQGKYEEMHYALFSGQDDWSFQNDALSIFRSYGADLELDTKDFDDCLQIGKYEYEIAKDIADGESYTVRATPTVFIGKQKIVGAQSYELFKRTIDAELAKMN